MTTALLIYFGFVAGLIAERLMAENEAFHKSFWDALTLKRFWDLFKKG